MFGFTGWSFLTSVMGFSTQRKGTISYHFQHISPYSNPFHGQPESHIPCEPALKCCGLTRQVLILYDCADKDTYSIRLCGGGWGLSPHTQTHICRGQKHGGNGRKGLGAGALTYGNDLCGKKSLHSSNPMKRGKGIWRADDARLHVTSVCVMYEPAGRRDCGCQETRCN